MSCIQSVKDTKFKAIHNIIGVMSDKRSVVFNLSKIQNLKRFTTFVMTHRIFNLSRKIVHKRSAAECMNNF